MCFQAIRGHQAQRTTRYMQFEQCFRSAASSVISAPSKETQSLARFSLDLCRFHVKFSTRPRFQLGVSKRYGIIETQIWPQSSTQRTALGLIETKITRGCPMALELLIPSGHLSVQRPSTEVRRVKLCEIARCFLSSPRSRIRVSH